MAAQPGPAEPFGNPRFWHDLVQALAASVRDTVAIELQGYIANQLTTQLQTLGSATTGEMRQLAGQVRQDIARLQTIETGMSEAIHGAVAGAIADLDHEIRDRANDLAEAAAGERSRRELAMLRQGLHASVARLVTVEERQRAIAAQWRERRHHLPRFRRARALEESLDAVTSDLAALTHSVNEIVLEMQAQLASTARER